MSKYKIGIIVTWFGKLPDYFSAWLASVKRNPDIDFLIFCDHKIETQSPNVKFHFITLEQSIKNFEKKLGRKIEIRESYKFCDCRAFFGVVYEDYLRSYDFWGYCDIDLVFGNIRKFLTDKKLDQYDRFYQYGHLSIFRNTERINHLYKLSGSVYKMDEIFIGKAKTTFEEYCGLNRICQKNNIAWYTKVDFADFRTMCGNRMEVCHDLKNYKEQIFVWHDGCAYRIYKNNGEIKKQEFIYMHQKNKTHMEGEITDHSYMIMTGNKIVVMEDESELINPLFVKWNPVISERERKMYKKIYNKKKMEEFLKSDAATKKIWIRQKIWTIIDKPQCTYS